MRTTHYVHMAQAEDLRATVTKMNIGTEAICVSFGETSVFLSPSQAAALREALGGAL